MSFIILYCMSRLFNKLIQLFAQRRPAISTTHSLQKGGIVKPPNILIKTDSQHNYDAHSKQLSSLLLKDRYTIYHLTDENYHQKLWMDSCVLLLYESNFPMSVHEATLICTYLQQGRVILYSTKRMIENDWIFPDLNLKLTEEAHIKRYSRDDGEVCLSQCTEPFEDCSREDLIMMLQSMRIKVSDANHTKTQNTRTLGYLFSSLQLTDLFVVFLDRGVQCIKSKDIKLAFYESMGNTISTENVFYIQTLENKHCKFNAKLYYEKLKTVCYGRSFIYTDVICSTQSILSNINAFTTKTDGLLLTAAQQFAGLGRSGNAWLSPLGCMMFSLRINISICSQLGRSLPFIQHVAVVAFVKSIKDREGCSDIDLHIKWPNDIYLKRRVKIGGVVVSSVMWGSEYRVTVGVGVNVNNQHPTDCLNSYLRERHQDALKMEDVIAGMLNEMEHLAELVQLRGVEAFKKHYYEHWLHSGTEVTLESYDDAKANVMGVDDFGYLKVKLKSSGEIVSLQPDGNSFDMGRNMVVLRKS